MKSKCAQETQDTRFVPEVWLTTKIAYISVDVPTTLVAPRGHLVHLGDKFSRVTNTQRLSVMCFCLKIERVTQELAQISPRRHGFD
jgi:hypothetical protein